MANEIGNGVKGKYMENMDYTIKNIDKLEDLKGHEWGYKNKKFKIYDPECFEDRYMLTTTTVNACSGKKRNRNLFPIGLKNLTELEFYGLKVILNEKPKLSREDKEFLTQDQYLARDENGILWLYHQKPTKTAGFWECANGGKNIGFSTGINHLFPFITWESGKAWSKSELMELEVEE